MTGGVLLFKLAFTPPYKLAQLHFSLRHALRYPPKPATSGNAFFYHGCARINTDKKALFLSNPCPFVPIRG
jgi:hypothetical protein